MQFITSIIASILAFFGLSSASNLPTSIPLEGATSTEISQSVTVNRTSTSANISSTEATTIKNNPPATTSLSTNKNMWLSYKKPDSLILKNQLDPTTFKVTQEEGTERAGTSPLDKIYEKGIYVDVLSGEPLFSSKDKFDSGTGWPSFVKPITPEAVTEHEDNGLFSSRTEIRSAIADNHLGHVFPDGPQDRGGERYCMNGVALRFIPEADMEAQGYGDYLQNL